MSMTRLLLQQGATRYRFLHFDARPDGSLVIVLDRSSRSAQEPLTLDMATGQFVPDLLARTSHVKVSCHVTGEIRYYCGSAKPRRVFYIDKLTALSRITPVAFFSIPRVSKLDRVDPDRHRLSQEAAWKIADGIDQRRTFLVEMSPLPLPENIGGWGVAFGYELYGVIVRIVPSSSVPCGDETSDHFSYGVPVVGTRKSRSSSVPEAELEFHHKIHGDGMLAMREKSGAYVVVASVPMRTHPRLTVTFNRKDLSCEQDSEAKKVHKVRFWIRDKGGRNLRDDLRQHIVSIMLDAEL
jgi:hypothetical protein